MGSKNKPSSNLLFQNLIREIIRLKQHGMVIKIKNKPRKIFLDIYGFQGDVPAKALVMNPINGYYGCPYCFIKGSFMKIRLFS